MIELTRVKHPKIEENIYPVFLLNMLLSDYFSKLKFFF